jgi:hypothetical protein
MHPDCSVSQRHELSSCDYELWSLDSCGAEVQCSRCGRPVVGASDRRIAMISTDGFRSIDSGTGRERAARREVV